MVTRRNLIQAIGLGGASLAAGVVRSASAQHDMSNMPGMAMPEAARSSDPAMAPPTGVRRTAQGYVPVRTLNGWTLPYTMKGGVKEFHLVAEEVDHEFAPGCVAKCWGYNGTTPGPTIEAVEGDRVRIFVTNRLPEHTSVHWHGVLVPSGMDGVGGLSQPHIKPGETFVYEFTLRQHGTQMYHPHADEMVQMAVGLMGMFIIHPKGGEAERIDRDYCLLLHNWALHPGTYRPDPSIMVEFDLWTFNSKVFPAIEAVVARTGERVRVRMGNLSMWNHPIHMHGVHYLVTGSDAGRWPKPLWRPETTEIVAVGQTRDIEFVAVPGDWAFHCHMSHHTMNAMGHGIPNTLGVDQSGVEREIRSTLPGYTAMGQSGMAEMGEMGEMGGMGGMSGMSGPPNTIPMMGGTGPFGPLEMGGMFTVVKVRDDLAAGDYRDPGWYPNPNDTVARSISNDPDFGSPPRRKTAAKSSVRQTPKATPSMPAMPNMSGMKHGG